MSHEPLPQDVVSLLHDCIATYEQLEIVLLLRAHAEQSWSVSATAERLNLPDEIAELALNELWQSRVLDKTLQASKPSYRYAPTGSELASNVDTLARVIQDRRAEILRLLSANAVERVRSRAIRAFADAFVLNRKRRDD